MPFNFNIEFQYRSSFNRTIYVLLSWHCETFVLKYTITQPGIMYQTPGGETRGVEAAAQTARGEPPGTQHQTPRQTLVRSHAAAVTGNITHLIDHLFTQKHILTSKVGK